MDTNNKEIGKQIIMKQVKLKQYKNLFICSLSILFFLSSCVISNNEKGFDNTTDDKETFDDKIDIESSNSYYLPIYSNLFIDEQIKDLALSINVSIRNSSLKDTIEVSKVNYIDIQGKRIKRFLKEKVMLSPLSTVFYKVDSNNFKKQKGGAFLIEINGIEEESKSLPLINAVMVGEYSNKAFSFSTKGYKIN